MSERNELNEEAERVRREVDGVMTFFKGYAPDFITGAVVDAICEACALTGIDEPTYENDRVDERETRAIWAALFSQTKMLSLRELKAEVKAEVAAEKWYPRQGSNLRPFAPEARATSMAELSGALFPSSRIVAALSPANRSTSRLAFALGSSDLPWDDPRSQSNLSIHPYGAYVLPAERSLYSV